MNTARRVPAILLACLLGPPAGPAPARAEGFPVSSLSYEYVPDAELVLTGVEEDDLKVTARTSTFKLNVPILLDGRDKILLNALTVRRLDQSYTNSKSGADTFRPDDLYTFKWGLVYRQVLGEKWWGAVLIQPAMLSDLENVGRDDFSVRAGFVFEKRQSDRFTWGWGAGYSDDYGRRTVLPVLRLRWTTRAWQIDLDAPQSVGVWRDLGERIRAGAAAKVTGGTFRIGQDVDLGGGRTTKDGLVRYSILNVGPAVEIALGRLMLLELNGGTSVYRRYEVDDAAGRSLVDSRYENTAFFKTTLSVVVD